MKERPKILIVESEFTTIDNLIDSLGEVGYEISGYAMTAEKAIKILDKGTTDIAILDIRLKGEKSGIWLGEQINKKYKIPFIYLSAFSDRATIKKASLTNPSTYLIKPFVTADIYAAIEIAFINFSKKISEETPVPNNKMLTKELIINDTIFVKERTTYKKIHIKDVLFVKAFRNYLELQLSDNKTAIIRYTLQNFIALLPRNYFFQTHRSYIVNLAKVEKIERSSICIPPYSVPMSTTFKNSFMEHWKFFS